MVRSRRRGPLRPYPRLARVNALVHEVLAEEIERLADADERLALVTITGVDCARDLRHAVVYLASLSPGAATALGERRSALQARLASEARLRRTPALSFAVDPAILEGNRIEEALRKANPPDAGSGPAPPGEQS